MNFFLVALLLAGMFLIPTRAQENLDLVNDMNIDLTNDLNNDNDVVRSGWRCSTTWCPWVWEPVCASNNRCIRQFSSACEVRLQNCRTPLNERYLIIPSHYCINAKPCQ